MVEDEPSVPAKTSLRPLNSVVRMESESDKDLKSELCSVRLEVEPTLPVRNSAAPFKNAVPMVSEPDRDLPIPFLWDIVKVNDPVSDLARPLF